MSQPANDEFSQHLSDDEESNHEDASDTGNAPKQQQQVIPQTTAISNIKLPILKKEEYDIWAMEMEDSEKGRLRIILLYAIPKEHMRRFHGMDDAKEIWEAIRTRFGGNANSKKMQKAVFKQQFEALKYPIRRLEKGYDKIFNCYFLNWEAHDAGIAMIAIRMKKFYKKIGRKRECTAKGTHAGKKKRDSFYQHQEAGKQEKNQMGLLTMDDGIVNWGEHTEVEETNHALMAISSSNEINDSGMSSNSKVGLGFEIQSNNEVLSYKEEMNFSVFNCSKEDSIGKPLYSRFTKTNDFKGVPHPLSGDYTPKPQEEIDDSFDTDLVEIPSVHSLGDESGKFKQVHNEEPWFLPVDAKATSENLNSGIEGFGLIKFKKPKQTCEGNLAIQPGPSCKAKLERLITEPLHTLHMDLFGPTSVKSINHASYCLVITDDCTRFEWGILFGRLSMNEWQFLQTFIRQIKNQLSHRVKIIRSDNGTEFKNRDMLEFCGNKGIKQEYSNARTPQQNGVAERMNRTLIEAARTMLAVLLSSSQHSCSGQKQLVLLAIFLIG
ncbi:putative ribonuclease H-like domain-containing protein [Tanacetum coccineum]|uniref:Ribonuclease H-like domain-containing protein n=1 Tax=Tanacetum coccineum TaxID=301880 RepID=A0ABQ5F5Q5_9ASTR